jgi:RimJ/RimL family protein N-acetyltransferase
VQACVPRVRRIREIPLPDPPLRDGMVTLRPWGEDDVPPMTAALQDPEIPRWTTIPSPYGERDAREYLARAEPDRVAGRELGLAMIEESTGAVVGGCGLSRFEWPDLKCEVGYWVAREARGRTLGTRAVSMLSHWALGPLGLERLELLVDPRNEPSHRLARSAGYTREGLMRAYRRRGEGRWDLVMYSLLANEVR